VSKMAHIKEDEERGKDPVLSVLEIMQKATNKGLVIYSDLTKKKKDRKKQKSCVG